MSTLFIVAESPVQLAIRRGTKTRMDNSLLPNHSNTRTGWTAGAEHLFAGPLPLEVLEAYKDRHMDRHMDNMDKGNMGRG
jgi:hypothetical protein